MKWLRLYNEVIDDPKVQQLHPALFKHWINLLCLASQEDRGGSLPDEDAIAFRLRVRKSEARRILDQLIAAELLEVDTNSAETRTLSAHNWQTRQRSSDNIAQRVARHRAGNGENVTLPPPLLKRSVDTDTDTDTEVPNGTNISSAKKPISYSAEFEAFWERYPRGAGSKKAAFAQWQGIRPDETKRGEIHDGLTAWLESDRWQGGYVKAAERWLRDEMWTNPPPRRYANSNGHGNDVVAAVFAEMRANGEIE